MPYSPRPGTKPKTAKEGKSFGGFFRNAGQSLKNLQGVPMGLAMAFGAAGSALYTKDEYGGGDFLKDLGKTVWKTTPIVPLLKGDVGEAGHRFYEDPLSALDIAAVFTGGAGLAGRGGLIAAKAGSAGSKASRIGMALSGTRAVPLTAGTRGGLLAAQAGQKARKAAPSEAVSGLEAMQKSVNVARIMGRTKDGRVIVPKTRKLRNSQGAVVHEIPLPQNPAIRARVLAKEALYSKAPVGMKLSPEVRGTRMAEKRARRIARRKSLRLSLAADAALRGLTKPQREATVYKAEGFNTAERLDQLIEFRKATLRDLSGSESARAKYDLELDIKRAERAKKHIDDERVGKAVDALEATQLVTNAEFMSRMIMGGMKREDAIKSIRARQEMPLREAKIATAPGERLVTVTHNVMKSGKGKPHSGAHGIVDHRNNQMLKSSGENFRMARYERDPAVVIDSMRRALAGKEVFERAKYAITQMTPYNAELHARGIADGTLKEFGKSKKQYDEAAEVVDFIDNRLVEEFGEFVSDESATIIADALDLVLKNMDGGARYVMPKSQYDVLTKQISEGASVIRKVHDKTIDTWRSVILNLAPRFYMNNFVGNVVFGLLSHPIAFPRAILRASMPKKARGRLGNRIREEAADIGRGGITHVLGGIQGPGFGASMRPGEYAKRLVGLSKEQSRAARLDTFNRMTGEIARHSAKLTEDNFRYAAFKANFSKVDKRLKKAFPEKSKQERIDMIFNDADAIEDIAQMSLDDMLDYSKMTKFERDKLIPLYPFWAFTRSMTGRTVRLMLDEPWKFEVLHYWGKYGVEATREQIGHEGELPDYMKGNIVLDPDAEGGPRVLGTYGMNPFMVTADLYDQFDFIARGEAGEGEGATNPVSQMSPFVKSAIEVAHGKDIFTGQKIYGSPAQQYVHQLKRGFPQYQALERHSRRDDPSYFPVTERTGRDIVTGQFGVPVGNISMDNLRRQQAIERSVRMKEIQDRMKREYKMSLRHGLLDF